MLPADRRGQREQERLFTLCFPSLPPACYSLSPHTSTEQQDQRTVFSLFSNTSLTSS